MRPLALRLQAFGSYGGELAIDFAQLGRHGVFSITGPTGAGKSTIFDAIVYALYDDLPGFRVNSHIRSQYAEPTMKTEVTLEFEADGRHWVLTRTPAQSRPSTRKSGGTVDDPSAVKLEEAGVGGSILTRKRDVGDRIGELVGLDKAQFEQVVLIPQGKFEDVLKAKTQERADLLAKLFPVDVYVRTTEALRLLAADRKEEYEALSQHRVGAENRIIAEVVAIRKLLPGGPTFEVAEVIDGVQGAEDTPVAPDAEADGTDNLETVDLNRLDDLRIELGALVATTTASRDAAAAGREAARAERAAVEERIVRWNQWRADTESASAFPAQLAADDVMARDLGRAADVAALGGALSSWRQATDRGAVLADEQIRLRSTVDARWFDTYAASALDGATSAFRLAANVSSDAAVLERADDRFADLEARGRQLSADEADLVARTTALATTDETVAATAALRAFAELASAAATDRAAGRSEALAAVERLERDAAAVGDRAAASKRLAHLTEQLGSAATAESEATGQLIRLRTTWQAGLAGRLAGHLIDGQPCPTCGATGHPAPAALTADAPGDNELETAESVAAVRTEERQRLEVQVGEARGTLDTLVEVTYASGLVGRMEAARLELDAIELAVADRAARLVEVARLVQLEATTASEADGERSILTTLSGALAERRNRWSLDRDAFVDEHGVLASTADRAARLDSLATAIEGLAANLEASAAAQAARTQALLTLSGIMATLGIDDPTALEQWALTGQQIADHKLRLAARAERRREISSRIGAYVADGGSEHEPDPTLAIESERRAVAAHDDLVGRVASMASRFGVIDAVVAELAQGSAAIAASLLAKEEADTLAGLCAGLGSGPDTTRLSLKNWVLAYYLRQVLAHANRRLHTMTNGRYALDLSGEQVDGRRPWGLDISALDAETGQSRPATTLSGGETFMAALALALGLADVVSAGSNYSIGALFVDEGFGSLDGDSLDTVIEVLRSLQDGGRMVGVISHVQELKDALPNGITIVPTNKGSVADIHYPEP
jgi:exonuclease SbcC